MAQRKLATHVHVRNPKSGVMEAFGPDDKVPDWAAKEITNPKAWEGGKAPQTKESESEYDSYKVPELEAEIDRRNEDRDPEGDDFLSKDGKKADLVAALDADDAAQSE